jgi:AraC-like DNA-binding protein
MATMSRAAALSNFVDVARQVGIDPFRALRRAGIDQRALADPELRIPTAVVNGLIEDAAAESGCPTFGLRMGEMRRLSDMGAISLLVSHQPTLRDVVATVLTYRRMFNDALFLDMEETSDVAILRQLLVVDDARPTVQANELQSSILFRVFRAILGQRWRPLSVNFTHDAPADLVVHRRVFGAIVEFRSQFNGMVLAAADLDRAGASADPAMARHAELIVGTLLNPGQDDGLQQVRKAVRQLLPEGKASLAHVAQSVGLNERTLQRRLAADQVQFSEIVHGVRRELAEGYLADPAVSVTEVARLLGYGQISSFTRWFVAEFGAPPRQWRKERLASS